MFNGLTHRRTYKGIASGFTAAYMTHQHLSPRGELGLKTYELGLSDWSRNAREALSWSHAW